MIMIMHAAVSLLTDPIFSEEYKKDETTGYDVGNATISALTMKAVGLPSNQHFQSFSEARIPRTAVCKCDYFQLCLFQGNLWSVDVPALLGLTIGFHILAFLILLLRSSRK